MNRAHYAAIDEKRRILRREYGGMMSLKDLCRELSFGSHHTALAWIRENALEGVRVGRRVRYETDQVAKIIVDGRGMV